MRVPLDAPLAPSIYWPLGVSSDAQRNRSIINILFDTDDGVRDGIAGQFDAVYESCLDIDEATALQALTDLQAAGRCSDTQLNGVAEADVGEAPCTDARDGCPHLLASGFLSCATDFSPTGPMAGACDQTCAFCRGAQPPPPCGDRRDGCAGSIASGFVSCSADFWAGSCPLAGQCGRYLLLAIRVASGTTTTP
eukprot:COSAG02_NODE_1442_length_12573_cov_2.397485_12_plen_194_part_00